MKFPPKTEIEAMSEWRERHPFDEWPIGGKATVGSDENKKKEARALIQAAEDKRPFVSVPMYNYTPEQYSHYHQPSPSESTEELRMKIQQLEREINELRQIRPAFKSVQDWEAEELTRRINEKMAYGALLNDLINSRLGLLGDS